MSQRLISLDFFRGFTIAAMIVVNDPGSWSYVYAPDGTKIGEAKCIAFRGICSAGIASYLTGLLDQ